MKRYLLFIMICFCSQIAFSEDDERADLSDSMLEGIEKLSCEAILCLSTGSPPSECDSALDYFYSLKEKKWKDTYKKRKNFLDICPTGDDMGGYTSVLAAGAGRCEKGYLLSQLNPVQDFDGEWTNGPMTSIPEYCKTYYYHSNTVLGDLPKKSDSCKMYDSSGPVTSSTSHYWDDDDSKTVCLFYWY